MTISSDLVKLMGSEIKVQSKLGKGSRFYCDLDMETANTEVKPSFDGHMAVVISQQENFVNRIGRELELLNINQLNMPENADVSTTISIMEKQSIPIIAIIDAGSLDTDLQDLLLRLKTTRNSAVKTVVVADEGFIESNVTGLADSWITDVTNQRQIANALRLAISNELINTHIDTMEKFKHLKNIRDRKVLVAEDVETNRYLISQVLERGGCKVVMVNDGNQALNRLLSEQFDIGIIDMQMPEMNGVDLIRRIKGGSGLNSEIPYVLLTGNVTKEAKMSAELAKVDAYLTKPIDIPHFLDTLEVLLVGNSRKVDEEGAELNLGLKKKDELIDAAIIHQLEKLGAGGEFVDSLIHHFKIDSEILLDDIRSAISDKNHQSLIDSAHALKGAAGNIGAVKLEQAATDIHHGDKHEMESRGEVLFNNLNDIYSASVEALKSYQSNEN
jgi:two-component system sensor histidine kinase RpfC